LDFGFEVFGMGKLKYLENLRGLCASAVKNRIDRRDAENAEIRL